MLAVLVNFSTKGWKVCKGISGERKVLHVRRNICEVLSLSEFSMYKLEGDCSSGELLNLEWEIIRE